MESDETGDIHSFVDLGTKINRFMIADLTFLAKKFPEHTDNLNVIKGLFATKHIQFEKLIGQCAILLKKSLGDDIWTKLQSKESIHQLLKSLIYEHCKINLDDIITEEYKEMYYSRILKYVRLIDLTKISSNFYRSPEEMYAEALRCCTVCVKPQLFAGLMSIMASNKTKFEALLTQNDPKMPAEVQSAMTSMVDKFSKCSYDDFAKMINGMKTSIVQSGSK